MQTQENWCAFLTAWNNATAFFHF